MRISANRQKIAVVSFPHMTYTCRGQGAGSFAKREWMLSPRPTDPLAEFTPHGAAQVWPPERLVRGKLVRRFRSRGLVGALRIEMLPERVGVLAASRSAQRVKATQERVPVDSEGCLCSESDFVSMICASRFRLRGPAGRLRGPTGPGRSAGLVATGQRAKTQAARRSGIHAVFTRRLI